MKKYNKYRIYSLVFIMLIVIILISNYFMNKGQVSEELKVLPPFIFVLDELYQGGVLFKTEEEFNNLEPEPIEIGSIKSKVSVEEIPNMNFQSNSLSIGTMLYTNKTILFAKDNDGKYWIFEAYEEN